MRLLDAILEANRRRTAGERTATVSPEVAGALPLAALTCIDPRLNHLLPDSLGIPEEQFIWLRNAGNIITGPLSSTMRSLALGCAVKGAKEIAIIGHSDCQVGKTTMLQLLDRLAALGVDRHRLPENLVDYFGLFGSERQNVIRSAEFVRASPLIGTKIPVHGLMLDLKSGGLECVVNGYDTAGAPVAVAGKAGEFFATAEESLRKLTRIGDVAAEELKLPSSKIGEFGSTAAEWLHKAERIAAVIAPAESSAKVPSPAAAAPAVAPEPPTIPANPLTTLQDRMRKFAEQRTAGRPPHKR